MIERWFERCTPQKKAECAKKNGHWLAEACKRCPRSVGATGGRPSLQWVEHLMSLHLLIQAGYPFAQDDLPLETWRDLGVLRAVIQAKQRVF